MTLFLFYLRTGDVPKEVLHYKTLAGAGLRSLKYREDQPRVPAGNPDGGQWTAEGGSSGENDGGGGSGDDLPIQPASLRNLSREVARGARALRNWWRGEPRPRAYDTRKDPLTPNGELIGKQGSDDKIRTVSPQEFHELKNKMLEGSKPFDSYPRYEGKVYDRPDGTRFGLRMSKEWGETIDVFESPNPKIENGTKVHQKWPSI